MNIEDVKPSFSSIDKAVGTVYGTAVTYNASTITYNSSTTNYGGFTGNPFRAPKMKDVIIL